MEAEIVVFQSLSRDSGRLNLAEIRPFRVERDLVSIPQSGFGAFELWDVEKTA